MKNQYRVPKKQWMKWSNNAKEVFNRVYDFAYRNQDLMTHPKQPKVRTDHWQTCAWNSAWIAADAVDDCIPMEVISTDGSKKKVA